MIIVIDNYDSFTYNLVQIIEQSSEISVFRNDKISIDEIEQLNPLGILISPGPGRPEDAGISVEVVKKFGNKIPVLGVCLGHQAIGYAYGCDIIRADILMHGKTSQIRHDGKTIYGGIDNPFTATRYHSLVISTEKISPELEVSARTDDGIIMGVRHKTFPIEGIQFHPESILTTVGEKLLKNWLHLLLEN